MLYHRLAHATPATTHYEVYSEETVDRLMVAASDAYESTKEATPSSSAARKPDQPHLLLPPPPTTTTTTPGPSAATATAPSTSATPGPPSTIGRFAAPLTEGEIVEARQTGIPEKTKRDTHYCTQKNGITPQ